MSQFNTILPSYSLVSNGRFLDISQPIVMGILNLSPDSFFDGGKYNISEPVALNRVREMIENGASIIDIGAASSKPGSPLIDPTSEWNLLYPFLSVIRREFPDTWISVDTYNSATAESSVKEGADIINDISAYNVDPNMLRVAGSSNRPYILMHMQGTPDNMQKDPRYEDVVKEVINFFQIKIQELKQAGVKDIILDPGFGFGKRLEDNYKLLRNINLIHEIFQLPVLAGLSRKSVVNKVLGTSPSEALTGTIAINSLALNQGATILRVHDIKEAMQTIRIFNQFKQS